MAFHDARDIVRPLVSSRGSASLAFVLNVDQQALTLRLCREH
jgi:hypothetical protein